MRVTIRHLRIFIAVAETGSMSAAANRLYLSQPTVSQAIRDLEDYYHVHLFERMHKKLFITEEGRYMLNLAQMAVGNFDNLDLSMQRFQERLPLRIGSSLTVGTFLMSNIISDLETAYPKMDLYSFVSNTAEIEQKLLRRELDVAVVEGIIESPELVTIPIVEDSLVLVCGKMHEFYRKEIVYASELEGQKFAMREKGSGTRKLFEQYLSAHNIHIRTTWEANCPRTILNAVIHNNALAVMSERLVKHVCIHQTVRIFRYETGEWDRYFKLVYPKRNSGGTGDLSSAGDPDGADHMSSAGVPDGADTPARFENNKTASIGIENLRTVLERYRTRNQLREIPAYVLRNDVL